MSFYWGIESIDVKRNQSNYCFLSFFVVKVGILFLWLSSFSFVKGLLSCFFYGVISIFVLVFSLYYPLKGWIHGKILCEFVLSWNTLVSPSMVIESFVGYSSLSWHLCSLRFCKTPVQDLAFIVSDEKSGVILIDLPLYVT